jgi:sulfite oxidase
MPRTSNIRPSLISAISRRRFLQQAGVFSAVGYASRFARPAWSAEQRGSAEIVAGKDPRLTVHSAHPVEIETPLEILRTKRITPKEFLFVRNNQSLENSLTTKSLELNGWKLEVVGLVEKQKSLDATQLADMEQAEVEMVLQCSGNGRAMFSQTAKTKGSQWTAGAMGNVRFSGVRLKTLLDQLDLNIESTAKFVTAEGRDSPLTSQDADFEHSIPLEDALTRSIIALRMNGEPLPAIHGGPLRLVTPGYYGTMNIKWLSRLRLEPCETFNHHQVHRYRTPHVPIPPGSEFKYSLQNSEPNWRMKIKSVIFAPLEGERMKPGPVEIRGVAWNDGSCRIDAVELSRDGGQTWHRTKLEVPESLYAWYPWSTTLTMPAGEQLIQCRAVDALGRTQPIHGAVHWNPAGYAWNGVHGVKVECVR